MYKTKCEVKPIKFIIKVYLNHDTLLVKRATYQKAESLWATSLSKLDNKQHLYIQFKVCGILCNRVGALSISQPYLFIQPSLQSPQKFSSANFHCIIPLLLKTILTIPDDTLFYCASAIPQLPIFACSPPCNVHQKYFPCFSYLANSDCINGPLSMGVLAGKQNSQLLILYRSGPESWCIVGSSLWWRCLQSVWKTIQSTLSLALNYCYYFHTLLMPS